MQFTREVAWSRSDFVVMGGLLLGTGLTCERVLRLVKTTRARMLICFSVLLACVFLWLELAVGIFGSLLAGS